LPSRLSGRPWGERLEPGVELGHDRRSVLPADGEAFGRRERVVPLPQRPLGQRETADEVEGHLGVGDVPPDLAGLIE